jgi:glutamate-1-semialdehyde aminotransferase
MAHLLPVMAGLAFLDVGTQPDFYPPFLARAERFAAALREVFGAAGLTVRVQHYGPRFSLLFGITDEPRSYRDVAAADRATELRFYGHALEEGVYLHHGWHHGISAAHTEDDLDQALERLARAARRTAA